MLAARPDPYATLGVSRRATAQEVKRAYRARARDTHPDKHRGDEAAAEERFREVAAAYELLSDARARARFDGTGRWEADPPPRPPPRRSGGESYTHPGAASSLSEQPGV